MAGSHHLPRLFTVLQRGQTGVRHSPGCKGPFAAACTSCCSDSGSVTRHRWPADMALSPHACSACGVAEALGRRQTVNDLRQQIQDLRRQLDNERSRAERAEFEREDALDQNDVLNKRWDGVAGQDWPVVRWAVSS